jgi:Short C-terminal domain
MLLRRRPAAVVARTAVVAGTATAVSNRVSRRQANRSEGRQQEMQAQAAPPQAAQQAPPPSAGPEAPSDIEQLQQLAKLHEQGILTDDEFAAKKKQILGI